MMADFVNRQFPKIKTARVQNPAQRFILSSDGKCTVAVLDGVVLGPGVQHIKYEHIAGQEPILDLQFNLGSSMELIVAEEWEAAPSDEAAPTVNAD